MKKIFLKSGLLSLLAIGLFSGCASDDHYTTPEDTLTTYELTTTTTVAAVKAAAPTVDDTPPSLTPPIEYTAEDIIEAYVTSSDAQGTFYKSISFQTIPTDGSNPIGFSVPLNATTLFGKGFTPGRKVYIKLKGLYTGIVYGSLQIGSLYEGTVGRISEFEWKNHLFPSATVEPESAMLRTMTLAQAYSDANQNTLVDLDGVEFSDSSINRTYYDVDSGGGATNHMLTSTAGGTERIIRFSSFAPFTGKMVKTGSGKIRGVLTKYQSDFQFIVRYEKDIQLTLPRFDATPAVGGTAMVFGGTMNEPFTSYTITNQSVFPKYINDPVVGSRLWQLKTFSGNKYIEMSSFNGSGNPGVPARTLFLVPVDFTAANTFTFKKEIRFNSGGIALKVYYVTAANYTLGTPVNMSNFVDITSSFNIGYPAVGSSENAFSSPGTYNIPASLAGNGYFVFEYIGTETITTTVQIDDIIIN
ncbi:DUF5689 domain-containing protein [Flavobacterium sangjuense]|uniref:DUF5689 domain-containing protein n=1 Tax=Flavobacterium sangjuense TaxID=2518177 RepID=A0A4P7PQE4_9FLAO|nr:DUF5689 domain-containing protein [Flavobacterium sangjuense]QBZ97031.1 hypothetical protein GS03_00516 [Flavobacterium sangjuense]